MIVNAARASDPAAKITAARYLVVRMTAEHTFLLLMPTDCGTTDNYCYSPNCPWKYGPACPINQHPEGKNTSLIPRPKFGSVPYGGAGVDKCKKPGTVALTFDDGPQKQFTNRVLNLLKSFDAKTTFFVTSILDSTYIEGFVVRDLSSHSLLELPIVSY